MNPNPKTRITAKEALQNPWISVSGPVLGRERGKGGLWRFFLQPSFTCELLVQGAVGIKLV